jgi:hypothetical protein
MHASFSRRRFLQVTSGVSVAALLADGLPRAAAGEAPPIPTWCDKPMRWGQLTLVEDDPGKYDPQFWLDYFRETHCDAVCLSAGGCVAYYPTQIPFHHRSQWMGTTDPFGELVVGCRELGLVVIARTDPHATYQDVFEAHPDWIAVDARGEKRRHWASPEMWVTCALGPYNFEFMTEVKKEIMSRYHVDGIFINRWNGSGMCYCEHCQQSFRSATGQDLPRTNDPQDRAHREYIVWRQQRLFDLWRLWDGAVRQINPDSCVIPNTGGGATSLLAMEKIGELAPTLIADRQGRAGLVALWANGKNAKEFRAAMGRKPIVGIFSVGLEERYRWKDSVQSEPEVRLWALEGIANGLRPWFTKFAGTVYDPRWLRGVKEVYQWHHEHERYLRQEECLARVGLVYSQQTAWFYGGERAESKVEGPTLGVYQALIEGRIPFEMVHDRMLDPEHLKPFRLLILPNIAAVSDRQCDQIRQYVAGGGRLLATYETSLYDEWGRQRSDFGLADLFGVSFKGHVPGPMQNSYLRLDRSPGSDKMHPLLAGLEEAPRIINGVWRVEVEEKESFPDRPLTLIPSYPDLPMEKVYPRQPRTDVAQVFLREPKTTAPARIVFFPWDIDRTFWDVLCVDHGRLLKNAVHWALDEEPPVRITGPGVIDVTVWRQKSSMTIHLVNLTNPMMMKGPLREFIPLREQDVRIKLPKGTAARQVQFLVSKSKPAAEISTEQVKLTVPSLTDHEVIAIDLERV